VGWRELKRVAPAETMKLALTLGRTYSTYIHTMYGLYELQRMYWAATYQLEFMSDF
jgi:hypothetical protein